jgi:hypothetical protein
MPIEYLHPNFIGAIAPPVSGDSPLMAAIRRLDQRAALQLLNEGDIELSETNEKGETALFLALRTAQFDLSDKLLSLGAPDANIHTDDRYETTNPISLILKEKPFEDADIDSFLAEQPDGRRITYHDLVELRHKIAKYIDTNYPRSQWLDKSCPSDLELASNRTLALRQTGFAHLGQILDQVKIDEIRQDLQKYFCYNGHVIQVADGQARSVAETSKLSKYACYDLTAGLTIRHLWDVANSAQVLTPIADYFGCMPTLYATNILWSFPTVEQDLIGDSQSAHRDFDDFHFVVLFLYLTDVNETSGPHRYYKRTHDQNAARKVLERRFRPELASAITTDLFRSISDCYGRTGLIEDLFSDQICDVNGPAGTAFLADTYGLHRASSPISERRLIAWFRYGLRMPNRQALSAREHPSVHTYRALGLPAHDPYINRVMFRDLALRHQRMQL